MRTLFLRGILSATVVLASLVLSGRPALAASVVSGASGLQQQCVWLAPWGSWCVKYYVYTQFIYDRLPQQVAVIGTPVSIVIKDYWIDRYQGFYDYVSVRVYITNPYGQDIDYVPVCRDSCDGHAGFWQDYRTSSNDAQINYSMQSPHWPPYGSRGKVLTSASVETYVGGYRGGAANYWIATMTPGMY